MNLPPAGICVPCRVVKVIDGDTVEITALTGARWRLRQLDCWCSESNKGPQHLRELGLTAKAFVQEVLDETRLLHAWIPIDAEAEECVLAGGGANLLNATTFNRVVGHLFVSQDTTLADLVVRAGHGYRTKKELQEAEAHATASQATEDQAA